MKALSYSRYGGPDMLALTEVSPPVPREREVLVRVHATSINAADRVLLLGKPLVVRLAWGLTRPKFQTLGLDVAGRVVGVGSRVTAFSVGDPVFGAARYGAFADLVCVSEDTLVRKPAGIGFEQAAATPTVGYTALQGLRKGGVQAGQQVLIVGASGGVGTFAVQLARAFGADVTAVCSTRNVAMVRRLGASRVIDYRVEDFTRGGQRYDVILAANAYRPLADYRRVLAADGNYVMTGGGGVQALQAMLMGAFVSMTSRQKMGSILAVANRDDLAMLGDLLAAGSIAPVIDRTIALADVPAAITRLEKEHAQGKVVVRLDAEQETSRQRSA